MNSKQLEITRRTLNGQFQNIDGSPYRLDQQKLVRIGSAKNQGDLYIDAKEIEPLHLLLRVPQPWFRLGSDAIQSLDKNFISTTLTDAFEKYGQRLSGRGLVTVVQAGQRWQIADYDRIYRLQYENEELSVYQHGTGDYELLNVSSEPITVHHPTAAAAVTKTIGSNGEAVALFDYDYVQFGNNNFLLTYQSCECLQLDLAMPTRRLKAGQVAEATLSFKRCPETKMIETEDLLDYSVNIRGGDPTYCRWEVVERTNNFSGLHGGYVKYRCKCIADCPEPAKKLGLHFIVSLANNGRRLYSAARGLEIELAPCGPFALTFTSPNLARRSP